MEHGIQLKKGVADIARNWWSERWFKIIDEFGLGIRWERAKLYAERGQVVSIEIENGLVRASVQGSGDDPYRVMVSVKTIPKSIWTAILKDLGKTSAFAIGLSSGSLPPEEQISQVFQENGVLLFPDRQGELHTKCTCLDWSNPCKHIAAVYLLLGAEFDRDPFLLFKLRGLEQGEFFQLTAPADFMPVSEPDTGAALAIGGDQDTSPYAPPTAPQAEMQQASAGALGSQANVQSDQNARFSEPQCFRQFWNTTVFDGQILGPWSVHAQVASLPASLGEFPFWQGSENFLERIRCAYESVPEHAKSVLVKGNRLL